MGYAQQYASNNDLQSTNYGINELAEFSDAYTSNYFTQGTTETHKNFIV